MMKRVIAFSLWGHQPKYWVGAQRNLELAESVYPGWVCRFYVDEDGYNRAESDALRRQGAETLIARRFIGMYGSFWRHAVALDPEVERYIVRDTDSRICEREAASVHEWIESDKPVHLMRDHPAHVYRFMCGLYGAKGLFLAHHIGRMGEWPQTGWRADTEFFNQRVLPQITDQFIEHDDFHRNWWTEAKTHPKPRESWRFLGESFDEHGTPNAAWTMLRDACA